MKYSIFFNVHTYKEAFSCCTLQTTADASGNVVVSYPQRDRRAIVCHGLLF